MSRMQGAPSEVTGAPEGAEANACGCDMYFHPCWHGWVQTYGCCC